MCAASKSQEVTRADKPIFFDALIYSTVHMSLSFNPFSLLILCDI